MTNTTKIEVFYSKKKLARYLLVCILFLTAGIWLIITNPETSNPVFNNPVVKAFAFYGAVIMGIAGIYFFSKKMLYKQPAVVIDQNGITENSGAVSFGFIPWGDISWIEENSMQASLVSKQKFITIGLKEPETYILKQQKPFRIRAMRMNTGKYGTPLIFSANTLTLKHNEILKLLKEYHSKYKKSA